MPVERQTWNGVTTMPALNAKLTRVVDVFDTSDRAALQTVTATGTLTLTYPRTFVKVDTTAGNVTLTLPPARTVPGFRVEFKKLAAANTVTLDGHGAETIDNAATFAFTTQYTAHTLVSDGAAWWVTT